VSSGDRQRYSKFFQSHRDDAVTTADICGAIAKPMPTKPALLCAQAIPAALTLSPPSPACIRTVVAQAFAVPPGQLRTPSRGCRRVAVARQCAMYLAHVLGGLSFTETGRAFGRDRTTAAYACRRFEELRDDPTFDAFVEMLETRCSARAVAETAS
jgi:hypothetical protein